MAERRRVGAWIRGALGMWVAAAGVGCQGQKPPPTPTASKSSKGSEAVGSLARGDGRALAELAKRMTPRPDVPPSAFSEVEAAEAVAALVDVRAGFAKFTAPGRSTALGVAGLVLARFGVDPAPACWVDALGPSHDVLTLGLADADPEVRTAALVELGRLWSWMPGRTPGGAEEQAIDAWKQGMVAPAVRRLADAVAATRGAAVACLAKLPINDAAAPAAAYISDPDASVRQQALVGFASRRDLLSEEAILPLLYDPNPAVAFLAKRTLMARGLTTEQVALCGQIVHPVARRRAGVIPQLLNRTDIDPVVWLLQLSRDPDESVRVQAVEALATRDTPEARRRLREMAQTDESARIRAAAAKAAPGTHRESTVALPPLPGSQGLNPRAN